MLTKDSQDFIFEGTDCFVVYGLSDRFYKDKAYNNVSSLNVEL